jgi:hypothetical protein
MIGEPAGRIDRRAARCCDRLIAPKSFSAT